MRLLCLTIPLRPRFEEGPRNASGTAQQGGLYSTTACLICQVAAVARRALDDTNHSVASAAARLLATLLGASHPTVTAAQEAADSHPFTGLLSECHMSPLAHKLA